MLSSPRLKRMKRFEPLLSDKSKSIDIMIDILNYTHFLQGALLVVLAPWKINFLLFLRVIAYTFDSDSFFFTIHGRFKLMAHVKINHFKLIQKLD